MALDAEAVVMNCYFVDDYVNKTRYLKASGQFDAAVATARLGLAQYRNEPRLEMLLQRIQLIRMARKLKWV